MTHEENNEQQLLLEAVADIAFIAGGQGYYSGDSREDIAQFILWARQFEALRMIDDHGNETYNGTNYMLAVEAFALEKLKP